MRFLPLTLILGCAALPDELLAEDPGATGQGGERGPLGADLYAFAAQARVTERLPYDVVVPVGGEAPYPLVAFVQGGFAEVDRYHWLAAHLASRGYVVVLPDHDLNLAIAQSGNAELAIDDLLRRDLGERVDEDAGWATMGHSLGGVISAGDWRRDERYAGLAMLASLPADYNPVEQRTDGSVLSIIGSEDGSADIDRVANAVDRFDTDAYFALVDGMNHYTWTDDPTPGDLAADNPTTRPDAETRVDGMRVIDTWLDAVLREDAAAQAELASGDFPGVEWTP